MFIKLDKMLYGEIRVTVDASKSDDNIYIWNGERVVMSLTKEEAKVLEKLLKPVLEEPCEHCV